MKVALIIPIHKQKQHWMRMQSAIERLSVRPHCVYVMMDRPLSSEYEFIKKSCQAEGLLNTYKVFNIHEIPEFIGRPNNLPDQSLFLTGHRRNLGIEYAISDGCECFVFIDGDCVPQTDLIKSHLAINDQGIPNLSIGRRRDGQYNWRDQREVAEAVKSYGLFSKNPYYTVTEWYLLETSTIVWSCNMSLNIAAVNRLKKFNRKYYGRDDVFHSDFLGTWGGEDGFIGIEAYKCGIRITMLGDSNSGIKHIHHERPVSKYAGEAFTLYLNDQVKLLEAMMENSPIPDGFLSDFEREPR